MTANETRERVRELVMRHGWNATCYQTVNPVFDYAFYDDLDAVVAYVRTRRRRVIAGAPICAAENLQAVSERFAAADRVPIVYFGAGDRVHEVAIRSGPFPPVSLGAQPVWKPSHWFENVISRKSLRYQFSRAKNKGVTVREWTTAEAENSPALRAVLDDWLGYRGLPPLHFLVEPETLDFLMDRRTFVAEVDGEPVAFLNLCPVPQRYGWLTEQFPRRRKTPNGTVELLMHVAAQTVAAEGAEYLTMGLVPFSKYGRMEQNPWWLRKINDAVRTVGRPFYSIEGLNNFKSKFGPELWEPIYAVTPGRNFSFVDFIAVTEAFAGISIWRMPLHVLKRIVARIGHE